MGEHHRICVQQENNRVHPTELFFNHYKGQKMVRRTMRGMENIQGMVKVNYRSVFERSATNECQPLNLSETLVSPKRIFSTAGGANSFACISLVANAPTGRIAHICTGYRPMKTTGILGL
mmetsp:Transcript_5009/g.14045  ORF Transcript_5009/g.14045 Transcript_5009/m.14045 type:complete len:120 (+) Transcript_5009:154-513(+)